MELSFEPPATTGSGTLAVLVAKDAALGATASAVDAASDRLIARALALAPPPLERGQVVDVVLPEGRAAGFERVLLIGAGDALKLDAAAALELGAALARAADARGLASLTVALDDAPAGSDAATFAGAVAEGLALRTYRFDAFKSTSATRAALASAVVRTSAATELAARAPALAARVAGVHLCRDLVNRPPNDLGTDAFVAAARELGALGVEVEVLDRERLEAIGMRALLGVAQGSRMPPYVVVMTWRGGGDDAAPLALVGKGVVFDSGGLSLKPPKSMETMKCDMAGAGTVVGAMRALATRKAKANVVGAIGLVENMPSGTAQRPGDVVAALSGQTIEVLNTDAEGRLVLADMLWYVQDRFKPRAMMDFATLTGAVITALGHEHAGLFANDDTLAGQIEAAGRATGETVWRLPLGEAFHRQLDSATADLRNIGRPGEAGAVVAACFLERFVNEVPWAHVDLAGTSFVESEHPLAGKGGTGWGVRLVDRLVADGFEGRGGEG